MYELKEFAVDVTSQSAISTAMWDRKQSFYHFDFWVSSDACCLVVSMATMVGHSSPAQSGELMWTA